MYRRSLLAAALAAPLARPALAQPSRARTLRFMPQAALANLDPIFSPSTIITTHAYCVFDTLYGANRALQPRPQMAEGHSVEDDGKRVKIRLRDGLPPFAGAAAARDWRHKACQTRNRRVW